MGTKQEKKIPEKTKSKKPFVSLVMIGSSEAGKSALILSYEYMVKNNIEYNEQLNRPLDNSITHVISIIGISSKTLETTIKDKTNEDINCKVKIWDTPGNERFYKLVLSAINSSQGILLTYDITNCSTFENLNKWIRKINECKDISVYPIIIVGCKADLEDKREVSTEEGKKFAEEYKFPFFETSALTGKGVKEAFYTLIKKIYDRKINQ